MKLIDPATGQAVWDSNDPYAGPVPPAPEGRQWVRMDEPGDTMAPRRTAPGILDIGSGVQERLGFLNQTFNPVEGIGGAMRAGSRMMAPDQSYWDRIASLGEMASGVAGIAAPIAAARAIGVPAATAMMEGLLGFSPTTQAAGDMARQFGVNEYGGVDLNRFPFYHGTPDARDVRNAGGFAANKPVFLSDNPNVARTYADPRRAWDYQGAEPEVFRAMTSPERVLDIDAKGADFRGISVDAVKSGLIKAGIPESEVSARISAAAARRNDNRISTNDLIDIVRGLGFDAADIANVRDTYNATAKAPKSTVRMMFNPSQINIPNLLGAPSLPAPRTDAEAMARDILQLRAEGRAADVTDDMMAAADPQYMYSNTPLPMDYASRLARAEAMGLSPDEAYHGTPYADIQALRPSGFGAVGPGVYVSRSTDTAGDYARGYGLMRPDVFEQDFVRYTEGGNVTPVRVPSNLQPFNEWSDARMKDMQRQGLYGIGPRADEAASAQAQDLGFEGVAARNENAVIFDPSRIRSRFARFDPAFAHLRNLSAGVGGAAVLTALGDDAEAGTPEMQIIGLVNQAGIAGAAEALGVSRRDIEEAISIAVPPSQWDQLVVGPQ